MNLGNLSVKVDAAQNTLGNSIISGNYYYIKNVRSGKYLTLQNNSTADNTLIVQWHFNAGNNQKWRFEYFGDTGAYGGEYQIVPYNNTNKAIQMVTASSTNGVEARLATKSSITRQYFRIEQNYTSSRRFVTNGSNFTKVLEINGASVDDNAKLIQYSQVGNGSDQFLIEPVNYDPNLGKDYADVQVAYRIMTYPNFNKYEASSDIKLLYQQCNFVSQCMCASGYHYETSSNIWYCNKNDFYQPTSFSTTDLANHWQITNSWYKPYTFTNTWQVATGGSAEYSYDDIINNNYGSIEPELGSIVIIRQISGNITYYDKIGYISEENVPLSNSVFSFHIDSGGQTHSLCQYLVDNYQSSNNKPTVIIMN